MKILSIDHHELFRDALRHMLQKLPCGMREMLEAGDWMTGLEYVGQHPDLDMVLLELKTPGCNGTKSVNYFRRKYPDIRLVVVSADEDFHVINKVLDYGACGFVGKSSPESMLLGALRVVLAGNVYVPPQVFRYQSRPKEYRLTQRQEQMLACLAEGLSNREIAERFELSEGTVKAHVAAVLQALRVRSRHEAVGVAARVGLMAGGLASAQRPEARREPVARAYASPRERASKHTFGLSA